MPEGGIFTLKTMAGVFDTKGEGSGKVNLIYMDIN